MSAKKQQDSALRTPLLPHQQRVVDRISQPDQPGLVVAHGLGSGKTLTSIAAQEALGMPSTVVVPAALRANYEKERTKHLVDGGTQPAEIHSLQNVARKGAVPHAPLLIVDEAHRARESGTRTQAALAGNTAEKRLLLTGSPFYNHPADLSPLINIAAGERVLPNARAQFAERYIATKKVSPGLLDRLRGVAPGEVESVNPRTSAELAAIYGKYVDHHPGSTEGFPTVERRDIEVPMSREQLRVYDTVMGAAPPWFARKVRAGLPPSKAESKALNAFSGAVRQVSNTTRAHQPGADEYAPKIDAAASNLQRHLAENPNSRAVVYSNYLDAGLRPYAERLTRAGVAHGLFTGDQTATERNEMVRRYNAGELKALLLSSAGGEGLDLKGTRLMQVLEPHWNDEKIKQVEGRGVRYQSHADLPEAERKVLIERYLSTRPRSGVLERLHLRAPGGGIDRYLADRSQEKEDLLGQFRALLPKAPPPTATKETTMPKKTASLDEREYMRGAAPAAEAAGRGMGGAVRRVVDAAERGVHAAGGPFSAGVGALQGAHAADVGDGVGGALAGVAGTAAARGLVDYIPASSPNLRTLGEIASPLIGGHAGGRLYSRAKRVVMGPRGEPASADYVSYEDARQKWAAAAVEQVKAAGLLQRVGQTLTAEGSRAGHIAEVAGLGMLAANPIDELQAKARSKPGEEWEHKSLLGGEKGHAINDIAGLGVLAAPSVAHLLQHKPAKIAAEQTPEIKQAARAKPGGDVVTVRAHVRRKTEKRAGLDRIPLEVGFFHELEKVGTVTPEEARAALERLDTIDKTDANPAQVRRYAALGAAAGLATDVGSSIVSGAPYFKAPPGTPLARTRAIGASALRGAVASGVIPLVRAGLDRAAATNELRRYVAENNTPTTPEG